MARRSVFCRNRWRQRGRLEPVGERDADVAEDGAIAEGDGSAFNFDEAFGLAAGGVEGDSGGGGARARFGILQLGDEELALSMRALDLVVRALGPRRSQSISIRTRLRRLSWARCCHSTYASRPSRNLE